MDLLYVLAVLACPVGMGVMMWFMMRGNKGDETQWSSSSTHDQEIAELRAEVETLRRQADEPGVRPGDKRADFTER